MSVPTLEVADRRILFVMAVEAEYGEHLQARLTPLMTGVGPVESAVSLTAALGEMTRKPGLPDLVVSLGSAGSRKLEQAEVYQVTSVSYRDMDASVLGFEKGVTPFLDLPRDLVLPLRIPDVKQATLSTGADVVYGAAYDGIAADMVDMETYALLRACQHFALPLIGLRGISDGRADLKHVSDWSDYLHLVDEKLAEAVDRLFQSLEMGTLEAAHDAVGRAGPA